MNTNRVQRLTLGLSAVAAALWGLTTSACAQPELFCASATGNFNLRLQMVSGTVDCLGQTEVFAVQTFFAKGEGRPAFEKGSVAITEGTLFDHFEALEAADPTLLVPDPLTVESQLHAIGSYATAEPNSDDICTIPSLMATVSLPAIPDDAATADVNEAVPATMRSYNWTNVQVQISPEVQGSILWGDLAYTADGCSATYAVKGVWPAMGCMASANECFCANGVAPGAADCEPTGLNPDFAKQIACVEGACVFNDVARLP